MNKRTFPAYSLHFLLVKMIGQFFLVCLLAFKVLGVPLTAIDVRSAISCGFSDDSPCNYIYVKETLRGPNYKPFNKPYDMNSLWFTSSGEVCVRVNYLLQPQEMTKYRGVRFVAFLYKSSDPENYVRVADKSNPHFGRVRDDIGQKTQFTLPAATEPMRLRFRQVPYLQITDITIKEGPCHRI